MRGYYVNIIIPISVVFLTAVVEQNIHILNYFDYKFTYKIIILNNNITLV